MLFWWPYNETYNNAKKKKMDKALKVEKIKMLKSFSGEITPVFLHIYLKNTIPSHIQREWNVILFDNPL